MEFTSDFFKFGESPTEERHLTTWISPRDFTQLVINCIKAPHSGKCRIIFGISDNSQKKWFDRSLSLFSYKPLDDAQLYAEELPKNPDPWEYHGGSFC